MASVLASSVRCSTGSIFSNLSLGGRWWGVMVRRRLGVLVASLLIAPMIILMLVRNPDMSREQGLVEDVSELRAVIEAAQTFNRHRLEDISKISAKVNALLPDLNSSSMAPLTAEQKSLLRNYSVESSLRLPSVFSYLPHLLHDPQSLTPAFVLSRGRTDATMVLGIPTVQREVQSYLLTTLTNLVTCMSPEERNSSVIVVLVAETDISYVHKVASLVEKNLPEYLDSGLIEIISPQPSFYPDLENLKQTLGDKPARVKWRTKQNLDFAFLMMYAQTKGLFYVQLEDDVQTKKNYISTMKSFALQKTHENKDWFVLDFCQLGFIGKMFKCAQLPYLVQFFLMFANDKPVDWLLDYLVQTKSCSLDHDAKECKKAKGKVWIRYKPSLFQHIGTHSSLKGKVQKLKDKSGPYYSPPKKPPPSANKKKDKQFGKVQMFFPHTNPPAAVSTNIKPYKAFTFEKAYRGDNYFWGLLPQQGDEISIVFSNPITITKFLFRSGNVEHPSDRMYNTTVEVLPVDAPSSVSSYEKSDQRGYFVVGKFDDVGLAEGTIGPSLGPIAQMKLRVHADSDNWAIISEVEIKSDGNR